MAAIKHDPTSRYRYATGGQTTSNGRFLGYYDKQNIAPASDDVPWVIEVPFENRPDLIANRFLGNPRLAWVILLRNDILNPLTELTAGKTISIPSNNRVQSEILS